MCGKAVMFSAGARVVVISLRMLSQLIEGRLDESSGLIRDAPGDGHAASAMRFETSPWFDVFSRAGRWYQTEVTPPRTCVKKEHISLCVVRKVRLRCFVGRADRIPSALTA
ncbi:unnamed protein product, partial [Scytosiphon promiscuus]